MKKTNAYSPGQRSLLPEMVVEQRFEGGKSVGEFYQTPEKHVQLLLDRVKIPGPVLEPCAQGHSITRPLTRSGLEVYESDIAWPSTGAPQDATQLEFWEYWRQHPSGIKSVVTNFPFTLIPVIAPLAFPRFDVLAMFARLSYQEPCSDRGNWLIEHSDNLAYQIVVSPRPDYRADKGSGDNVTSCWLVWMRSHSWAAHGCHCPFLYFSDPKR